MQRAAGQLSDWNSWKLIGGRSFVLEEAHLKLQDPLDQLKQELNGTQKQSGLWLDQLRTEKQSCREEAAAERIDQIDRTEGVAAAAAAAAA